MLQHNGITCDDFWLIEEIATDSINGITFYHFKNNTDSKPHKVATYEYLQLLVSYIQLAKLAIYCGMHPESQGMAIQLRGHACAYVKCVSTL